MPSACDHRSEEIKHPLFASILNMFYCLCFRGYKLTSQLICGLSYSESHILQDFHLQVRLNDSCFLLLLCNYFCVGLLRLPPPGVSGCLVQDQVVSWWLSVPQQHAVRLGCVTSRGFCNGMGSSCPPCLGFGPRLPRGSLISRRHGLLQTQSPAKQQLQPLLTTISLVLVLFSRDIY